CYKCGGPRENSTGEGEGLRPGRAIQARLVSGYRSSIELAMLAGFLILVVVGIEIYTTVLERSAVTVLSSLLDRIAAGGAYDPTEFDTAFARMDRLALPGLAAFVAALLAFATWLSVVVGNIPGLGGGEPSVTRLGTFVWAVIPVVNLRRIPKIIQEVLYRLDPRAGGVFMVGLAWIGLVGSWILARIVGLYLSTRLNFDAVNADSISAFALSSKQLVEWSFGLDIVTTAMITFGAVTLVAIIAQVERRQAARNREIEATLGPTA
ncbi:MAG TPA: hypothetical protein VGQ85_03745, partial [Candidatus Limnocylindrales bacterium]|nr:hypothetical protein [Candidatus Limnocylindrales bacterium]